LTLNYAIHEKGKSTNVTFKDVAGLEGAKEENQEISLLDGIEANHIISSNNNIENEDIYNFQTEKKED
jgi:hypothetical protein